MSIVENILGKTEKLIFKAFSDSKFEKGKEIANFKVQYNPAEFGVNFGVDYEEIPLSPGQVDTDKIGDNYKLKNIKLPEISFEFILDGTGASSSISDGFKHLNVEEKIKEFKNLCFVPNSTTHTVNFIQIIYGNLIYKTVGKSIDIKYTLFRNDGYALRAKITAKFITIIETDILSSSVSFNSPDVTHKRTLKEFDNLISISNTIYEKNNLYQEVARFNNLNSFRGDHTGLELYFPPLKK